MWLGARNELLCLQNAGSDEAWICPHRSKDRHVDRCRGEVAARSDAAKARGPRSQPWAALMRLPSSTTMSELPPPIHLQQVQVLLPRLWDWDHYLI